MNLYTYTSTYYSYINMRYMHFINQVGLVVNNKQANYHTHVCMHIGLYLCLNKDNEESL